MAQRSFRIVSRAAGTPVWMVGYLRDHPSAAFARSFLSRVEQVMDSAHNSPASFAHSSLEMEAGRGLPTARETAVSHSFWMTGWSSPKLSICVTGRSSEGGAYP